MSTPNLNIAGQREGSIKHSKKALILTASVSLTLGVLSGPGLVTTAAAGTISGKSCVYYLEPLTTDVVEGATEINAQPVEKGCYSSIAESVAAATGGNVQLPQDVTGFQLTQAMMDAYSVQTASLVGPDATVVIGIDWDLQS